MAKAFSRWHVATCWCITIALVHSFFFVSLSAASDASSSCLYLHLCLALLSMPISLGPEHCQNPSKSSLPAASICGSVPHLINPGFCRGLDCSSALLMQMQVAHANAQWRQALCEQYFAVWLELKEPNLSTDEAQGIRERLEAKARQTQSRQAPHPLHVHTVEFPAGIGFVMHICVNDFAPTAHLASVMVCKQGFVMSHLHAAVTSLLSLYRSKATRQMPQTKAMSRKVQCPCQKRTYTSCCSTCTLKDAMDPGLRTACKYRIVCLVLLCAPARSKVDLH